MKPIRYNVLLIEQDSSVTDFAQLAAVESFPEINLTVIGSGDAILECINGSIDRNNKKPHIILLDMNFPKLDGLAVLRSLRMQANACDIPVVAFSSVYTQDDVLISYQVGANSFVPKPVDSEQFKELFGQRLDYWFQLRQDETVSATGHAVDQL